MKLMIASTAVMQNSVRFSLEALREMQKQVCDKTLFYNNELWVVSDVEIVSVVIADDADHGKTYVLMVDFTPAASAENMVHTNCEMCGRVSHLQPDQAELGGVPLDVCLRDQQFTQVLVRLMKAQGIKTDLRILRGTVETEG